MILINSQFVAMKKPSFGRILLIIKLLGSFTDPIFQSCQILYYSKCKCNIIDVPELNTAMQAYHGNGQGPRSLKCMHVEYSTQISCSNSFRHLAYLQGPKLG